MSVPVTKKNWIKGSSEIRFYMLHWKKIDRYFVGFLSQGKKQHQVWSSQAWVVLSCFLVRESPKNIMAVPAKMCSFTLGRLQGITMRVFAPTFVFFFIVPFLPLVNFKLTNLLSRRSFEFDWNLYLQDLVVRGLLCMFLPKFLVNIFCI